MSILPAVHVISKYCSSYPHRKMIARNKQDLFAFKLCYIYIINMSSEYQEN